MQRDNALNCGQAIARVIFGEIAVNLGGEVRTIKVEESGLNVECAVGCVKAKNSGRRCLAFPVHPKNSFDGSDAIVGRQQRPDIGRRQKHYLAGFHAASLVRTGISSSSGRRSELAGTSIGSWLRRKMRAVFRPSRVTIGP